MLSLLIVVAAGCGRFNFDVVDTTGDGGQIGDDGMADAALSSVAQRSYIKPSNTGVGAMFGIGMALSADGSTLAVGAPFEASAATGIDGNQADTSASQAGAAYVFVRSGSTWVQQAYVKASNTDAGDNFGISVALSADGSTLAVGAYSEGSAATGIDGNQADNSAALAGAAYVFVRGTGGGWTQQAYVKASNTDGGDSFGDRVALSSDGSTLVVSSYQEDGGGTGVNANQADNSAVDAGAAYVFTRTGTTWSQQAYLKPAVMHGGDLFGFSLSLSNDGSLLAIGAEEESSAATGVNGNAADTSAPIAGAAYVFSRSGTTWKQDAYLKGASNEAGDAFGVYVSLSLDGSTLAVGAYFEDSADPGNPADNSAGSAGAAYVFTRSAGAWSQQAYLKGDNTEAFDLFGTSTALSADGNTLVVGAIHEASSARGIGGDEANNGAISSGAVYVFTRTGAAWTQHSYIKSSNSDPNDELALRVALSANGATLAVVAYQESSAAVGIDGDQADNSKARSGAAYVFE